MRRLFILLAVATLAAPLMFYGCGSDGSAGPAGPAGDNGATGPPGSGIVAVETCTLCHGTGKTYDVAVLHSLSPTTGNPLVPYTVNAAITGVTFTPNGDNVVTAVTFTFATANSAGTAPAINLLDNSSATQLRYVRFSLAQLIPGAGGDANEWFDFVNNNRVNGQMVDNGGGSYTYTFLDNAITVSGGFLDNLTTRAAIQISSLPAAADAPGLTAPVANPTFDLVPDGSAIVTTKDDVTTAACNRCHDPLAIHGGGRQETKYCVVCHNPTLASGAGDLGPFVHRVHTAQDNTGLGDFGEVTYPQPVNNCLTCHQGTDDFWKSRPTMEACGACHTNVNFATGAGHLGGAQTSNAGCALCHPATAIPGYHAAKDGAPPTPSNPVLAGSLHQVDYAINSVTVDNTNAALVQFTIRIDNVVANLGDNVITAPTGFTGSPAFLLAYALPQDGVTAPVDYNNLGRSSGQPQSVNVVGLTVTAFDNTWYTVKIGNAFPAGAKLRAVALQGYFTQTSGGVDAAGNSLDNVARHTISVQKAVTGDAVRRVLIKSGYNATTGAPEGCLECHEFFEGHGGNRNNNVQVCVMCHNPSLTTSGRTIVGTATTPINPDIVALFGSDPLAYPEVADNLKSLIHGFHASGDDPALSPNEFVRTYPYIDIRNRTTGGFAGVLLNGSEVAYPGNLMHCTKCHYGPAVPAGDSTPAGFVANSYKADLPANVLNTTTKVTTGVATETLADINAARASMPNATDLVVSPLASACGYCHDSNAQVSHMRLNGAAINVERGNANLTPPQLGPESSLMP
jgi:OmcA/MtrC family decaheme c-type cytochrome